MVGEICTRDSIEHYLWIDGAFERIFKLSVDFFKEDVFASFQKTLDGEMKRVRSTGAGKICQRRKKISGVQRSFSNLAIKHYILHVWIIFWTLEQTRTSAIMLQALSNTGSGT